MPLFNIKNEKVSNLKLENFKNEKILQALVEKNLLVFFNCRFVATEFSTGVVHGGRIDTLALSEDNNLVIIEYKTTASSDLLNQSLFYLSWMMDHKGDFEIVARKALGNNVEIDFSDIRVICIAPDYKKYDLHAAKSMGANIELWSYKLFENGYLIMDEIYSKSGVINQEMIVKKDPKMINAGKKAAVTRKLANHSLNTHQDKTVAELWSVFEELKEFILDLDSSIQEVPKQYYIAYKKNSLKLFFFIFIGGLTAS